MRQGRIDALRAAYLAALEMYEDALARETERDEAEDDEVTAVERIHMGASLARMKRSHWVLESGDWTGSEG
jgi:hypothetical protein